VTLRLAVVATGTGVGKTTTALALLGAARVLGLRVAGWKPLETGGTEDGDALQAASDRRCPSAVLLPDPVSPHLAARRVGARIDLEAIAAHAPTPDVDLLLMETAGGLFSPLDDAGRTNAELVAALAPDAIVLVAPNRLGVLHDVAAVLRGAPLLRANLVAIALTGGDPADRSADSNAEELARLHAVPVWGFPNVEASPEPMRAWLRAVARLGAG
jgi:dethiobiotin synthetase